MPDALPRQVATQVKRGLELEEQRKQGNPPKDNGQDDDPAPDAKAAELEETIRRLQDRVNTLTGMLDKTGLRADNERLQAQKAKLEEELDSTRADLGKIQQRIDELEAGQATGDIRSKLDALDEDDVPPAMKEIITGQAEQIASLVKQLRKANDEIESAKSQMSEIGQSATQSKEDVFFDAFYKSVPDAREINRDQSFKDWMGEVDPRYLESTGLRASRQALLEQARNRYDVETCVKFYKSWKELAQSNAAVPSQDTRLTPPSSPGSGEGKDNAKDKIWTVAEFNKVTQDAIQGRIGEDEYNRLHQDYTDAAKEGRLRMAGKR